MGTNLMSGPMSIGSVSYPKQFPGGEYFTSSAINTHAVLHSIPRGGGSLKVQAEKVCNQFLIVVTLRKKETSLRSQEGRDFEPGCNVLCVYDIYKYVNLPNSKRLNYKCKIC